MTTITQGLQRGDRVRVMIVGPTGDRKICQMVTRQRLAGARVLVGATLIDQKAIPEAPTYSFGPDGTEKIGRKLVQYFLVGPEYDVPRQSIN